MPPGVIEYITNHGYLAIFLLVFAQEIGIPNPVPNELVLMFSGYLTFKGIIYLPLVILTAMSADFIGTVLLYTVFYFFGTYILKHKPRWLPISDKKVNDFSSRISKGGQWSIYIGRFTPLVRGYTSVITGFLRIKPVIFLPIALITATAWSAAYVIAGRMLGPYWSYAGNKMGEIKFITLITVLIILIIITIRYFRKATKRKQIKQQTL